jgi:hypothetical protein
MQSIRTEVGFTRGLAKGREGGSIEGNETDIRRWRNNVS